MYVLATRVASRTPFVSAGVAQQQSVYVMWATRVRPQLDARPALLSLGLARGHHARLHPVAFSRTKHAQSRASRHQQVDLADDLCGNRGSYYHSLAVCVRVRV